MEKLFEGSTSVKSIWLISNIGSGRCLVWTALRVSRVFALFSWNFLIPTNYNKDKARVPLGVCAPPRGSCHRFKYELWVNPPGLQLYVYKHLCLLGRGAPCLSQRPWAITASAGAVSCCQRWRLCCHGLCKGKKPGHADLWWHGWSSNPPPLALCLSLSVLALGCLPWHSARPGRTFPSITLK